MKATNRIIIEAFQAIQILGANKLPWEVSLQIAKLKNELDALVRPIEETRMGLVRQHQKVDEEDNGVVNETGDAIIRDRLAFDADFNKLMDMESDDVVHTIKLPTTIEVEPNVVAALMSFLELEGE